MSERQTRSSRHLRPSRNKKLDKLLNVLIGIVVVLIILTATYVFKWQDDAEQATKDEPQQEAKSGDKEDQKDVDEEPIKEDDQDIAVDEEPLEEESEVEPEAPQDKQDTLEESTSDDPIVDKVITSKHWQPTPTTQTGQHVSSYDDKSVDWAEKVATVTTVTGIDESNMIIWRMQNNGGPNSTLAVVSTNDKSQIYRVSMEWVDNEGWLPVKLEQLNTLEGAY